MTDYIDFIDSNGNEWTRTSRFREAKETIAAQAAVIESLKSALEQLWNGCENLHDNALDDYDRGYTRAMADSCKAALAIPTDSTQILDEVRRAERERVAKKFDSSDVWIYFSEVARKIRAME